MKNKKNIQKSKAGAKDAELKKLAMLSERELMTEFRTSPQGLTKEDAAARLEEYGLNEVVSQKPVPWYLLFLRAFEDPFVYILALLMMVSAVTRDYEAATVMTIMIMCSVVIRFVQEYRSQKASLALKEMIENTCSVTRDNEKIEIPMDEVVPGDIVNLSTGDMIPADAALIWTKDLFVN